MRLVALVVLVSGAWALDTRDFGVDPTGTADVTAAIQGMIDALPTGTLMGSSAARKGGLVELPAGRFRICTPGVKGRCVGGSAPRGTACLTHADCPAGTGMATPRCTALSTNGHAVTLSGQGAYATEIVAYRGCNGMDGVTIAPGDDRSRVIGLRLVKIEQKKVGDGHGLVIRGQRAVVRDVALNGWGGNGLLLDGEYGVAKANNLRLDQVEATENGGDGVRFWSHGPTGVGDGSVVMATGVSAQANGGVGVRVDASKSLLLGLETNGNAGGGLVISGDHNIATLYAEIANQPVCTRFEATADYNTVTDMSGCGTVEGLRTTNHVLSKGAWLP